MLALISVSLGEGKCIHKFKDSVDGHKNKFALHHSRSIAFIPQESIVGAVESDKLQPVVPVPHPPKNHSAIILQKMQEKLEHLQEHIEAKREKLEAWKAHLKNHTEHIINKTGHFMDHTEHVMKNSLARHNGQLAFVPSDWASAPNSTDSDDPLRSAPAGYVPVIIYGLPPAHPAVTETPSAQDPPMEEATPESSTTTEMPSTTTEVPSADE